jgi:glutathione S-transferase
MKLYFSPGACSLSPHIVLCEAGLDFTLEKVNLKTKVTESGADYWAVNPVGSVPALDIDGVVLTEGPAIVQYLADQVPDKKLAPAAGTFARYQLMSRLNFISSEVHKSFSPLFNPAASDELKALSLANVRNRFDKIVGWFGGRPYVMGEQFSVADAYLFTILNWCAPVGLSLSDWPELQQFHARVAARPAVQQAMQAEGLLKS